MESTGVLNKIQISASTADYLLQAGKQHWVTPREDAVKAKGKGVLHTFWLNPAAKADRGSSASSDGGVEVLPVEDKRQDRRVDWVVEILLGHIQKIVSFSLCIPQKVLPGRAGYVVCLT
jgi:hypothetical protein